MELDEQILKLSCGKAIENGSLNIPIDPKGILEQISKPNFAISPKDFYESLEILNKRKYLDAPRRFNATNRRVDIIEYKITFRGFDKYLEIYWDNYNDILKSVAFQIVNLNEENIKKEDISPIYESVGQDQIIVDHFLEVLERRGHIKMVKNIEGRVLSLNVSPELTRMLRRT